MLRLIKYAFVVVPVVTRFAKSPRGQKLIAKGKARLGRSTGSTTGR